MAENLKKSFVTGVAVGICLHQNKVIVACEKKKALRIGEDLYYIQNGRERLQEMIDKICQ